MDEARASLEIEGLIFGTTAEGHVLQDDVRRQVQALAQRVASLESENNELRTRAEHVTSLQRLAEATVAKADELAAEIEAEARARADALIAECEAELAERRRSFDVDQAADVVLIRERVAQLQTALEGSVQTLARALQVVGAPALEMPPPIDVAGPATPPSAAERGAAEAGVGAASSWQAASIAPPTAPREERSIPGSSAVPPTVPRDRPPVPPFTAPFEKLPSAPAPWLTESVPPPVGAGTTDTGTGNSATFYGSPETPFGVLPAAGPSGAGPARESGSAQRTEAGLTDSRELGGAPPAGARAASPAEAPITVPPDPGAAAASVARRGPETIEIDMRPVRSFADLARVTKLLGGIAPGAQPVDLNLPQHRALFSVRGRDRDALAAELAEALPEAKVVERDNGIDVLLAGQDS